VVGVDPGWRRESCSPVGGQGHLPAAVVDDPVVVAAE
jgi:hypothetical protein